MEQQSLKIETEQYLDLFSVTTETLKWSKSPRIAPECSLRSGVALAPEILYFSPLSIVTKQEPQRIFLALFDVFLTSRFVNLLQLKMEEDVL